VKSSAPSQDNDGNALVSGALYFDSTSNAMKVYDGSQWLNAYASLSGALIANQNLSDLNNAATARTNLGISTVGATGAFSDLTGTPTTVSGYGITDAFDGAFSSLTGKPTTVSGYGITDAFDGAYSSLTGTPTIPSATSDLTNDSGFITSADGGNAATLDGLDSTQFLRSDVADTAVKLTFGTGNVQAPTSSDATTGARLILYPTGSGRDYSIGIEGNTMWFNSDDNYKWYVDGAKKFEWDNTAGQFEIGGNKVWHAGNDGSGSGLDADTLDGQQGSYYNQRAYTSTSNYLGGHYVSGGSEKPNASALGAGKLKPIMLSGSNIGGGTWNDVLWMSTYSGGDVKRSTAIVSSKYDNTSVWVNKVNYDSSSWGTSYLFWNSGNDGSGSGLDADTVDGIQASSFLRSDADDTTSGTITISRGNPVLVLNDTDATNDTNQTGYVSLQRGGSERGWIGFGSSGNTDLKIRNAGGEFIVDAEGAWNTFNTAYGYIQLGPANTGHAHIYTDRSNFYFNKTLIYALGHTMWHAGNDGSGSGLDADTLDGYQLDGSTSIATRIFNNKGQTHATVTNFNTAMTPGPNYIQANTNGPGVTNDQWYGFMFGLGSDYGTTTGSSGHYAAQMYFKRNASSNANYLYMRSMESGSWGSWLKVTAGYADSAGNADTLDGYHANTSRSVANTIPVRDQYGYLQLGWINTTSGNTSSNGIDRVYSSYDGYIRYSNATNFLHRQGLSYYRAYDWLEWRDTGAGLYWSNSTGAGWHIYPQSTAYMRFRSGHSTAAGIRCNTAGTDRNYIYWNSSNQLGFLTTAGGWAFKCDNSGNVTATGNVTAYSDIRLKTDIAPIEGALDRVSKLEGVEYTRTSTGEREIGFIAQDVITHEPTLVDVVDASTEEQEALPDLHVMKYQNTTALLVEAVKELKAEVDNLRQEIAELKKES
jgi:hypothetical protein